MFDLRLPAGESCFLWGPRQSGKSTYLRRAFPNALNFDLLSSEVCGRMMARPAELREAVLAPHAKGPVIIDEVQKVPALLDEVQRLIVEERTSFILCGSSARKLKRGGANLLGGRALRRRMFPLVSAEIPEFDLLRALNNGLIPRHYLAEDASDMLGAYAHDYLREEIAQEALTRNVPAFARFLEAAALSNGQIVNFTNIAAECGVSAPTARSYFEILEDTLLGGFLECYKKRPKRRVIQAPRFYLFDVGVAGRLMRRGKVEAPSEAFGRAFEHFILMELQAHAEYSRLAYDIRYWRTASGLEADFVLGDHEVVLEAKGTKTAIPRHLNGLLAFDEEYRPKRRIIVTLDPHPRRIGTVDVIPWREFLSRLWGGDLIA